jgi:Isochorismatase family
VWGPETNDLVLQLRKRKISKIILGGMLANMCVESHLRELLEQGFEVAVVKDATAGPADIDFTRDASGCTIWRGQRDKRGHALSPASDGAYHDVPRCSIW